MKIGGIILIVLGILLIVNTLIYTIFIMVNGACDADFTLCKESIPALFASPIGTALIVSGIISYNRGNIK